MRHMAIEMVCAHVGHGREPPLHQSDVLRVVSLLNIGLVLKGRTAPLCENTFVKEVKNEGMVNFEISQVFVEI